MKKILSFLVCFVMLVGVLLPNLSFLAFAESADVEAGETVNDIREMKSVSFSCNFDSANYLINLGGTVNHDALIKYRDYVIEIYAVPLGESAEKIVFDPNVSAIAETPIAVRPLFFAVRISTCESPINAASFCSTPNSLRTASVEEGSGFGS